MIKQKYKINIMDTLEYKCKKCHKEFKIKHYYIKHLAQCCSEENATDEQLSTKDERIQELKNKIYKDFSQMTPAEEATYKKDQVELLELQEEYRMDLRRKRLAARIKANESRSVAEIIAEKKRMKEAERMERDRIEKLTPDMLDEQQRIAQTAIDEMRSNEATEEAQEDVDADYKEGFANGRRCPRCNTVFKSNYSFKCHMFNRKTPCDSKETTNKSRKQIKDNTKIKNVALQPKNVHSNNNTYTTTTIKNGKTTKTTINGQNISELVKSGNFDILSNMGNMANFGTSTHTKQTVNQLNANSVRIVPPSQDDLDMVVKYIYDKFINEFEEYKQQKIEGYKQDMLERQKVYLAEKEKRDKQEEQKKLEEEKLEQERIRAERDADFTKISKVTVKNKKKIFDSVPVTKNKKVIKKVIKKVKNKVTQK